MPSVTRSDVEQAGTRGRRVLPHPQGFQCRMLDRFWVIADPEDEGFTPHAKADGYWEAWITAWFMNHAPGHAVIDVGANVGYFTFLSNSLGCPTVALEPQPGLADRLYSAMLPNDAIRVDVMQVAAGAAVGKTTLVVPRGHAMNASIAYEGHSPNGDYSRYEVDVMPLDELVDWEGDSPLLVKIDAEGAEELIWDGMQKLFSRAKPTTALLEFRWDRYADPMGFAERLFEHHEVSFVDYDSNDVRIMDPYYLSSRESEDWMLVIRQRT